MLVKFTSKQAASVSMFEKDARQMLKLMGRTDTIPSAIRGKDVADVLAHFQQSLDEACKTEALEAVEAALDFPNEQDNDEEAQKKNNTVPLQRRAFPLKQLLETAVKTQHNVMWDFEQALF